MELREGYTTGTCAAGAAKAGALMLLGKTPLKNVSVTLPRGDIVSFPVENIRITNNMVECSIKKDGGDDPDRTHGLDIFARVSLVSTRGIHITGGKGVGMVTRPGLPVPPGDWAINPVPRMMIEQEVRKIIPSGVKVEIFVPRGEEIGARTFNPRLGITGGISILGTTGIVKPMSTESLKTSLSLFLSQRKAEGRRALAFVPGNHGEDFLRKNYRLSGDRIVMISNYVGHMLREGAEMGFKWILLGGHIGKLVKISGGIFNTHSQEADCRMELLAAYHTLFSRDVEIHEKIMKSSNTEEAVSMIKDHTFFSYLAEIIRQKCENLVQGKVLVGCVLFSFSSGLLGESTRVREILKELL